jgi:hypothetical protein
MQRIWTALVSMGAAAVLGACGGGGGGGTPSGPQDLLAGTNSDFEAGGSRWEFVNYASTTPATAAVADCAAGGFTGQCLRMTGGTFYTYGNSPGDGSYVILRASSGTSAQQLSLVSGADYVLTFKARGSQSGMKVRCDLYRGNPGHYWLSDSVALNTTTTEHTVAFTSDLTGSAMLAFSTAFNENNGGTIELDEISLVRQ